MNLCAFLAKHEESNLIQEVKLRDKKEGMYKRIEEKTPENKYKKFETLPSFEREMEKYINPLYPYWQNRYYETLFSFSSNDKDKKCTVSLNYIEGLEWNMKYYTSGCPDWKWKYNYHYPPLLVDLLKEIPYFDSQSPLEVNTPVSELFQLYYVLPKNSAYLLPLELREEKEKEEEEYEFIWCFCKYFWECSVEIK